MAQLQGVSSCLAIKHSVFIKTIIGSTHSGNSDWILYFFLFLLFRLNKLFQEFREPHLHVHHLHALVCASNSSFSWSVAKWRVTRKHWPPIHGPPRRRTGSVDYLQTGPRTTSRDPSTDHPPNKIKNKDKDFTYCLSNRSLVSVKFRALRWCLLWVNVTGLGSASGASYVPKKYLWFLFPRHFVYISNC